jgi:phosphate uptake regulator
VAMEMTLVGWFYERLGAHAVNIARRVVYLAGRNEPAEPASQEPPPEEPTEPAPGEP